jgi:inner membrane protein
MRFPLLARFATVAGVALALLLPLSMIRDKVAERRDRAAAVQKSFADETAGPQALAGPLLALTCEETYIDERTVHQKNGKPITVREKKQRPCPTELFLPAELSLQANAPVEERYRGIYPIRLYRAKLDLAGAFELPPPPAARGETLRVWKEAFLVLGICDVRGIRDIKSDRYEFAPGTLDTRIRSGLHARLGSYANLKNADLKFGIALELVGTSRLDIAPLARQNDIVIESDWRHPSFVGAYSPDEREVTSGGFRAKWRVSHLATGGNAFWLDAVATDKLFSNARLLGVALVEPVNPYSILTLQAIESDTASLCRLANVCRHGD